jgi:hypothetical protein
MYHRTVAVTAYTAPGQIVMVRLSDAAFDRSDVVQESAACVDLDVDGNVIAIEIIDRPNFDLVATASAYGISDLVPAIEAAIATARPGP